MYVRKLNLKIRTGVNPKIKKDLIKKKSYSEKNIKKINFKIVRMGEAYYIMKNSYAKVSVLYKGVIKPL